MASMEEREDSDTHAQTGRECKRWLDDIAFRIEVARVLLKRHHTKNNTELSAETGQGQEGEIQERALFCIYI